MAKTLVYPQTHPGAALLAAGDKLVFELHTMSAAPIFSFKVDAVLVHDASTARHSVVGNFNKYEWEHPTLISRPGQVDATDIAVILVDQDTYDYKIFLKKPAASRRLLLHLTFAGPETLLRDTFGMVVTG